jgi:hypothetical protein
MPERFDFQHVQEFTFLIVSLNDKIFPSPYRVNLKSHCPGGWPRFTFLFRVDGAHR